MAKPAIRRARVDDAAALAVLAERTFRDAFAALSDPDDMELHCAASFGADTQRREIESPEIDTIVGELDGELIAFAQVRPDSPVECVSAKHPAELYRLYVLSSWHGRGVAHELMDEALATAKRAGSDRIWLGVWEPNKRALAFYRKFGFEIVGDHPFQFGNDPQTDLVMSLALAESGAGRL